MDTPSATSSRKQYLDFVFKLIGQMKQFHKHPVICLIIAIFGLIALQIWMEIDIKKSVSQFIRAQNISV